MAEAEGGGDPGGDVHQRFLGTPLLLEESSEAFSGVVRSLSRQSSADLAPYGLFSAPTPSGGLSLSANRFESLDLGTGAAPLLEKPSSLWVQLLAFTGPGWLMSIAYIDPGNLEADLQCGALYGYTLLWALFVATAMGLGMQLLAARLGCATRRHLAEHCQEHYPWRVRVFLWVMTELAIIGSDIQEVIGSSIGIKLLFGLPIPMGVVITAVMAFAFLFLERLGTRPLELFFGALIVVLALSMGGLFSVIKPDLGEMAHGLAIPMMPPSAVKQVVGMVGCVIMPHNLFLHSALVQSRVVAPGKEGHAVFLFGIESTVAILASLMINMSVVAIFSKGFFGGPNADRLGLASAGHYLGDQYGDFMLVIWGLGLCASGQSSTMTGAYAGQWVMQGYLQLQVKSWKRAIITRSMALLPTLGVAFYFGGGGGGLDAFNECLNLLQAVVLPFAVVPLLTFVGNPNIMGDLVLPPAALVAGWIGACLIMAANVYMVIVELGMDGCSVRTLAILVCLALYASTVIYVGWVPVAAWRAQARHS